MANPSWNAPIVSNTYKAGDITQNLFTHPGSFTYQGTSKVTGAVATSGTVATNTGAVAQYIDQPFTTAALQTTVTRIELYFQINGTGADLTIGLYADTAGAPSGAALDTIIFPLEFEPGAITAISYPVGVTGLVAATKYHIVIGGTASTSNFCKLSDGTTVGTQAFTSPTGVGGTWTGVGKSLQFVVYAGVNGVLRHTSEDGATLTTGGITAINNNPARWTGTDYAMGSAGTSGPPTTYREYVGNLRSIRTIAYSAGLPTTVT